ncbi:DoxX family protein [Larsenimonas suaedae]|uniref:DoxX family protein n=1 Tax=Larsenimonas suaedae TaxID=1851019 RepID=A0ABU1GW50_9GAMM|nr:DoxX family protein [Larsenimonas suaedae]MCM2973371.1 DoxX family protein [Larsenimonas suaedae]MDR5896264.1 DoxX family protein [Larsenimonas suaedae]
MSTSSAASVSSASFTSSAPSTSAIAGHDVASLLLRLALGVMFIAHGLTKVLVWTLAGTGQFFESIGLPAWVAWPITGLELVGGVLLILGVRVRWVALILAAELVGASIPHLGNGWMFTAPDGGWEYPVFLAVTALALSLLDGGKLTLSRLIGRN